MCLLSNACMKIIKWLLYRLKTQICAVNWPVQLLYRFTTVSTECSIPIDLHIAQATHFQTLA